MQTAKAGQPLAIQLPTHCESTPRSNKFFFLSLYSLQRKNLLGNSTAKIRSSPANYCYCQCCLRFDVCTLGLLLSLIARTNVMRVLLCRATIYATAAATVVVLPLRAPLVRTYKTRIGSHFRLTLRSASSTSFNVLKYGTSKSDRLGQKSQVASKITFYYCHNLNSFHIDQSINLLVIFSILLEIKDFAHTKAHR